MRVENYEVPQRVINALAARLRREPATATMLTNLAETLGVPSDRKMRVVDRFLQQHRKAGLIQFRNREWHWSANKPGAER